MRQKILTVDDSKTVRLIVRKAFRGFDCEILEASNGVEGLAIAAKESPHLILLDITMPVMDGVEMLSRLKADAALKNIPVIMLTAEGGRDNVLKIARIGVRDYLVKPFKEDVLVAQTGRVIDIKPLTEPAPKVRTIFDSADILLVEDQPALAQQIKDGLKHTPWKIHAVATLPEATEFCTRSIPALVVASFALEDEMVFTLYRQIRGNPKTKHVPIFALIPKADVQDQQQALAVGFNAVIARPVDFAELETRMAKAMNLDTSLRYYAVEDGVTVMRLPANFTPGILAEAIGYLKSKCSEALEAGHNQLVLDLSALKALPAGALKSLSQAMRTSTELGMQAVLAAHEPVKAECRALDEAQGWIFFNTLETAKAGLAKMEVPAGEFAKV
jgi:two-component system, cell cycle response regulator